MNNKPPAAPKNKAARPHSRRPLVAPFVFLSLLAVAMALLAALVLRQMFSYRQAYQQAAIERTHAQDEQQMLLMRLNELEAAYQDLMDNHSALVELLEHDRAEIARLRARIRRDAGQLEEVRQRAEQLQQQLEHYQQQLQELEAENQALTAENAQIITSLHQTASQKQQLEAQNQQLQHKLQQGALPRISGLQANPMQQTRRGERPANRARRTDGLQLCFTINENPLAEDPSLEFLVRITGPEGRLLDPQPQSFEYQDQQLQYTFSHAQEFRGQQLDVCTMWQYEDFRAGVYRLTVFSQGERLGETSFELR